MMTIWDFVTGVFFGIVVSCESLAFVSPGVLLSCFYAQAFFLLCKIRKEGAYVLSILVIRRCLPFVGQGCKECMFAMLPNRQLFFVCRVSAC